jgi:hypothetical protein
MNLNPYQSKRVYSIAAINSGITGGSSSKLSEGHAFTVFSGYKTKSKDV